MIQLNKLIVGEMSLFICTYLLSILAASYGISKFFRLGHARIHNKFFSKQFVFTAISSSVMLVVKGLALAAIVSGHGSYQRTLLESVSLWFLFSIVPSTIVVISVSIISVMISFRSHLLLAHWTHTGPAGSNISSTRSCLFLELVTL